MEVKQTEYGTRKNILFNLDPYSARPIMVADTGISADANGRKIVKAGSLLDKDGEIANDATVKYVLLQDIDVTAGDAAGAGVYRGTLDLAKIEANTGVTISEDAQVALKGIIFMSDADLDYVGGYTDDDNAALALRVTELEGVVGDAEDGLVADVAGLTPPEYGTIVSSIEALELAVGDEESGLVKDLADLATVVGDSEDGLVKDLADLDAIVNADTTGLVDRVEVLETTATGN